MIMKGSGTLSEEYSRFNSELLAATPGFPH